MKKQQRVLVISRKNSDGAEAAKADVIRFFESKKWSVIDVSNTQGAITEKETHLVELGVSIGGDGTFLRLVRRLQTKGKFPLVGINLGSLGFITDVSRDKMIPTLTDIISNRFEIQSRFLLDVCVIRGKKIIGQGNIFNDVVLNKDAKTTMIKLGVVLNQEPLTELGVDGYIVSTAVGSTAYNMSAGGPLLHPTLDAIVLNPICPHALSARSIVVPATSKIEFHLRDFKGKAYIILDGHVSIELKVGDRVTVSRSTKSLDLIQTSPHWWTYALKSKLHMN